MVMQLGIMKEESTLKYRNEIKYICSEQELRLIEQQIQSICKRDSHAGSQGIYEVRSVYFDDYNDSCYLENKNGVNSREKFRIRIYNGDMSRVRLECKQKQNGKNHKFSAALTGEQCMSILQGNFALPEEAPPLLGKFYLQYHTKMLRPKVIVQYERTPFIYETGNVRITFDRYVSGSKNILDFDQKKLDVRPVMQTGLHVLEVKYDEFLPDFIRETLQIQNLQQTAFSKYCMCRKFC